ncbi:MAG: D-alanine--D-alanine ligase [Methylococcales bacterium]|nr:D-alanine--D-alanine ligase [Methylococcales bacterium]
MSVDPNTFGRVAVVMGGTAAEREISLISGKAVLAGLLNAGVEAFALDLAADMIGALTSVTYDRVFNIVHGRGGEDGVLQAVLQSLHKPYTGSGVLASALSMDKLRTKMCWAGCGLPTPAWFTLTGPETLVECEQTLGFPVIVKPALEGSSIGMSKAENPAELAAAYRLAAGFNCPVFAEQWVNGHEYTVAVLNGQALPVIRLQTPRSFYDYEAKYQATSTEYRCPCGLMEPEERRLQQLALKACAALDVTGWGRVDVFIDTNGNAQLIEVNTVPGMTDHSLVPMAAKQAGMNFDALTLAILATSR